MSANGSPKGRIIVFGIAFWYPLAGVTYQFLHYLLGLRRLGWDPYYVEDSGRWIYDPRLNDLSPDASGNVAAVAPVLEAHGFAGRWAFRGNYPDGRCYGLEEDEVLRLYREADAFLNVPAPPDARYTTITTWHNKGKDLEFDGQTWYWTKDREFKKHLDLPARTGASFELAVGGPDEVRELLADHDWTNVDSLDVSRDVGAYRGYIQASRAEFTVARDQYVRPRTGWFSDRSACYLAAGRPVITEDTGFGKFLPTGEGLFAFSTTDEAAAAVEEVERDYRRHSRAALEIAREHFEAERVVGDLLRRAGL